MSRARLIPTVIVLGVAVVFGLANLAPAAPQGFGFPATPDRSGEFGVGPFSTMAIRGVMVIDAGTPSPELRRLDELGVRGARFHMLPGGAVGWDHLEDHGKGPSLLQRLGVGQ